MFKNICLSITYLFMTFTVFAHDFTESDQISNWRDNIAISIESIHDVIFTEAWYIFTGDDGEECDAKIWNLEISDFRSVLDFDITFLAIQDFENNYACSNVKIGCSGNILINNNGQFQRTPNFSCDWIQ